MKFNIPTIAVIILGALLAWYAVAQHSSIQYSQTSEDYNRAYWTQEFERIGPERAYEEFKRLNEEMGSSRQHVSAHLLGEVIYAIYSIRGIEYCDSSFGFGCYHGFFGRAIAEGGVERIKELDGACITGFGLLGVGCQHGLGHGILEYVGYEKLDEALELCRYTTQVAPLLGCVSGVFMEYESPLMLSEEGLVPGARPVDPDDPGAHCRTVAAKYRDVCYFELSKWMAGREASGGSAETAAFCATQSGNARTYCYFGIGSAATFFITSLDALPVKCETFADPDARACRAGVSWGFFSLGNRAEARQACTVEGVLDEACLLLSDLTAGKDPH